MSLPKAQLVDPQGNINLPGMNATGVITASSFSGVGGVVTNLTGSPDLDVGIVTGSSFIGDGTGHAASLTGTPELNLGITTSTGFVGDATGKAAGLRGTPNLNVGLITATSFVGFVTGDVTGNVTGDVTGNVTGDVDGDVEGNVTGNVSGLARGLGINGTNVWTGAGTSNLGVGVCTALELYGDGSTLTGAGSSAYIAQVVTASGSETIIDLTYGNVIYLDHNANTTIGFASTSPAEQITILKSIDVAPSPTLTWPSRVTWNDGTTPTPIGNGQTTAFQIFHLTTVDTGLNYRAWQEMSYDPPGNLFAWGENNYGQNGQNEGGSGGDLSSPTQIGFGVDWAYPFASNGYGGSALKTDGTLWTWGRNNYGQLGHNQGSDVLPAISSPTQIPGTWSNAAFTGGSGATFAVKSDGTAWFWGNGGYGGTGLSNTTQYSSPTQVPGTWDNSTEKLGGLQHAFWVIKTNGTLWSWGNNEYGELGQGNKDDYSSPRQVGTDTTWANVGKGGLFSAAAIKTNGTLWTWGRNNNNQLGQGNQTEYSSPKQVGTDTTWSRVQSVTYHYMMATKTDGTLWMWGFNGTGQLGQNTTTQANSPRQVGTETTWATPGDRKFDGEYLQAGAIKTDGTLWMWGNGDTGVLGNLSRQPYSSPIQIPGSWNTIDFGREHAFGTKSYT